MDFNSFTEKKKKEILEAISILLNLGNDEIILKAIKRGSVILTLELPNEDEAEKLFLLIKLGHLKDKGISTAKLKGLMNSIQPEQEIIKSSEDNISIFKRTKECIKGGKIKQALDYLDNYLEGKYDDFHRQIILFKAELAQSNYESSIGISQKEDVKRERNRIIMAILSIIDELIKKI